MRLPQPAIRLCRLHCPQYSVWVTMPAELALRGRVPGTIAVDSESEFISKELDGWAHLSGVELTAQYRQTYNRIRPHNSLGYRPPAPAAILPAEATSMLVGLT